MKEVTARQARDIAKALKAKGLTKDQIVATLKRKIVVNNSDEFRQQVVQRNTQRGIEEINNDPQTIADKKLRDSLDGSLKERLAVGIPATAAATLNDLGISDALNTDVGRGIMSAADFLGGALRTGATALVDPFVDAELLKDGELKQALNPLDGVDAVSGGTIARRATGGSDEGEVGRIEGSDVAGATLETLSDPFTYLSLGAVPAAKFLARGLRSSNKAVRAASITANAARKNITPAQITRKIVESPAKGLRGATKVLGRLTGATEDVVENYITNNKKFRDFGKAFDGDGKFVRNLTQPELDRKIVENSETLIEGIDAAQFKAERAVAKEFDDATKAKKTVNIKGFKDELRKIQKEFNEVAADNPTPGSISQAAKVNKTVDNILKPKNLKRDLISGNKNVEVPDVVSGNRAAAIKRTAKNARIKGVNADDIDRQLAGAVNRATVKLNAEVFDKSTLKKFQRNVESRKLIKEIVGDPNSKGSKLSRANKLQAVFNSAERNNQFARRVALDDISNLGGQNLRQQAADSNTINALLDPKGGRNPGEFFQNRVARGATNIVADKAVLPLFRGAARATDSALTQSLLNSGLGGSALINLLGQRALASGAGE